jgi:hypothetical protein
MRVFVGTPAEWKEISHLFVENPVMDSQKVPAPEVSGPPERVVEVSPEVIELGLTRIPLSKNQRAVLRAVIEASPDWISSAELAKATGLSRSELSGVWGALGRRASGTKGWPERGEAVESEWDPDKRMKRYRAVPALCQVAKSGRVKL